MSTWQIDPAHSEVSFKVKHLMISALRGRFKKFSGNVVTSADDFSDAKVTVEIDVASIDTNNEQRDGHLNSPDFFDVATFPTINFTSSSLIKEGEEYKLNGEMNMHGVAKPVTFDVTMNGITKGMDGARMASFEAKTKINREDFGLKWNAALDGGGVVVSHEVAIDMIIELKETK